MRLVQAVIAMRDLGISRWRSEVTEMAPVLEHARVIDSLRYQVHKLSGAGAAVIRKAASQVSLSVHSNLTRRKRMATEWKSGSCGCGMKMRMTETLSRADKICSVISGEAVRKNWCAKGEKK